VIPSRICPACGTRIADTATRCAVCGMVFEGGAGKAARMPARMSGTTSSLNLPVGMVIAGPVITLILGALIMMVILRQLPGSSPTSATVPAVTPTITLTMAPTDTPAPTFTSTPLPPIVVTVQEGDTCLGYASRYGFTDISLIKTDKDRSANCDSLSIGQTLYIPQPTYTPPPPSTATANSAMMTRQACQFVEYEVQDGNSLMGISLNYNVSMEAIKKWNPQYSFSNDQVMVGMKLQIPLCERNPTPGPTPTATIPPPYPAPNPLTPRDGTIFGLGDDDIALQWASGASLRDNEEFLVTIEDISTNEPAKTVLYVKDTRVIVPAALKPTDGSIHLFRWSVMVVRKTGTTDAGNPVYVSAGAASERRVFAWGGTAAPAATPTPQ
jgi:LysM repeat protein